MKAGSAIFNEKPATKYTPNIGQKSSWKRDLKYYKQCFSNDKETMQQFRKKTILLRNT